MCYDIKLSNNVLLGFSGTSIQLNGGVGGNLLSPEHIYQVVIKLQLNIE